MRISGQVRSTRPAVVRTVPESQRLQCLILNYRHICFSETMALTGHRSVQSFIGYYRGGEVSNSVAARLTDPDPDKK